jgi:radical SAM family uncharacterized protein
LGERTAAFLRQVVTPARYLGQEHNSVQKDPGKVRVRFALCYPDTYEIGMSHLGSHILYATMNGRADTFCERAYHPWDDAVALLRDEGLALSTLESQTPLHALDFVGITLQHELNYTTVLSLLDLAGITLRGAERGAGEPIVIGGGPCVYNPEPLAAFFDCFVIGEGEEVIHEILDAYASGEWGRAGARSDDQRRGLLHRLGQIEGVYVPSLGVERVVRKRVVRSLEDLPVPTEPVVAYCEVTHNRGQVEINRGCTRGCRFCQAGMIYRPVRERSVQTIVEAGVAVIDNTGFDELSLVSLNCPDYSDILTLVDRLYEQLAGRRVGLGLPSLRTDTFSVELAERLQQVRKTGLTFAPEAGSQAMRDAINKNVTEDDLLAASEAAFRAGWHRLKLYFMVGLPGETDEDVMAIADLIEKVLARGREVLGGNRGRLALNVSVAAFIPKPHTPFQWATQMPVAELLRRQRMLRDRLSPIRQVKLSCHNAEQALVEGFLARGGPEAADLVEAVYRRGALFESWNDRFSLEPWVEAAAEAGLDLVAEAGRDWSREDVLPWDHIDSGVSKAYLWAERLRSLNRETTGDCRFDGCSDCGVRELGAGCPGRPG